MGMINTGINHQRVPEPIIIGDLLNPTDLIADKILPSRAEESLFINMSCLSIAHTTQEHDRMCSRSQYQYRPLFADRLELLDELASSNITSDRGVNAAIDDTLGDFFTHNSTLNSSFSALMVVEMNRFYQISHWIEILMNRSKQFWVILVHVMPQLMKAAHLH